MFEIMIAVVDSREIIGNTPIFALSKDQFIKEAKRQNGIINPEEFALKFNNCQLDPRYVSILIIDKI